jgi:hypothetical protein
MSMKAGILGGTLYDGKFSDKKNVSLVCGTPKLVELATPPSSLLGSGKPNYRNALSTLLSKLPTPKSSLGFPPSPPPSTTSSGKVHVTPVHISLDRSSHLDRLTTRLTLQDPSDQQFLADTQTSLAVEQQSPFTLTVVLKRGAKIIKKHVAFPVPVGVNSAKIKFSRKTFLVEVSVAPLRRPLGETAEPASSLPFLTCDPKSGTLVPLGFPRVPLHALPAVDPIKSKQWVFGFCGMAIGASERRRMRPEEFGIKNPEPPPPYLNVKESFHSIAMHYIGEGGQGRSSSRFGLHPSLRQRLTD